MTFTQPTGERLLSLAAGTVLDQSPVDAVATAAAAGWPAAGLWYDPSAWNETTTAAVIERLADSGVVALDIEPMIFGRGADHGPAILDAAAAIGVRFLLAASGPADRVEVIDQLGALADLASRRAPNLTVVLEFLPIFTVGHVAAAGDIVSELNRPNLAVLVDTLHLARSGSKPADLAAYDRTLFPYLQLADATTHPVDPTPAGLREEALHGRLLPGDGELPLNDALAALPDVPISVELRSRALYAAYPDPIDRARRVLTATRLCTNAR